MLPDFCACIKVSTHPYAGFCPREDEERVAAAFCFSPPVLSLHFQCRFLFFPLHRALLGPLVQSGAGREYPTLTPQPSRAFCGLRASAPCVPPRRPESDSQLIFSGRHRKSISGSFQRGPHYRLWELVGRVTYVLTRLPSMGAGDGPAARRSVGLWSVF